MKSLTYFTMRQDKHYVAAFASGFQLNSGRARPNDGFPPGPAVE
jgi:hypothetical protein